MRKHRLLVAALAATLPLIASCSAAPVASAPAGPDAATTAGTTNAATTNTTCIESFDASTDYFPAKATTTHAHGYSIEYHNSYKVIRVPKPNPTDPAEAYVLVQCGAPTPELTGDLAQAQTITIPVQRVAAASATQIASLELLDALDRLIATDEPDDLVSPAANELAKAGRIAEFSDGKGGFDAEKVVTANPDVTFQSGLASETWTKLRGLGARTVADAGWLEAHPLGRAEWIKYYAAFLGEEAKASEQFDRIRADYEQTKQTVAAASAKPTVLVGTNYKGTWTVPGADGYVAAYVNDAGGDYVFADTVPGTGTQKMDNESILTQGAAASIWINGNWMSKDRWKTRADALAVDPRLGTLPAVADNQIWNPTKRIADNGGNDYWESGVVRPDLVLRDLASIFHPEQFPGQDTYYYTRTAE